MLLRLILLQVCAHLLADFIFQNQKMSDRKNSRFLSASHFWHFLIVWGCSFLLAFDLHFWLVSLIIALTHLAADVTKSHLVRKYSGATFFFTDQFFHLTVIVAAVWIYSCTSGMNPWLDIPVKLTAIVTGFILCAKPSNLIIQHLFLSFHIQTPDEKSSDGEDLSLPNAGKLIGIVERTLALALILINQFSAVGLIIAAKSILRFKGTQKSEYVLVGTLLSFALATLCGILINMI